MGFGTLLPRKEMVRCRHSKTFLWFDGNAEEAVDFWVSVFKGAKKGAVQRYAESFPDAKWRGKVMTATFTLRGQEFVTLNAGPNFKFTPAVSFMVPCATQQEIDDYWAKLTRWRHDDGVRLADGQVRRDVADYAGDDGCDAERSRQGEGGPGDAGDDGDDKAGYCSAGAGSGW